MIFIQHSQNLITVILDGAKVGSSILLNSNSALNQTIDRVLFIPICDLVNADALVQHGEEILHRAMNIF